MSDACGEAEDVRVRGASDEAQAERARLHRARCERCASTLGAGERIGEAVALLDGALDDVARARMLARLGPQLDELATRAGGHRRPRPWRAAWAFAAVAAVAMVALLLGRFSSEGGRAPAAGSPPERVADAPGVDGPAPAPPAEALAILQPYYVSGPLGPAASAWLAGRFTTLELPARATMYATLGGYGRIGLIGPARLSVRRADAGVVELGLEQGVLLADLDGAVGTAVVLAAPGAVVRASAAGVVLQVLPSGSTGVLVGRGAVDVSEPDGTTRRLAAGEHLGADPALGAALALLRDAPGAPTGPAGVMWVDGTPTGAEVRVGGRIVGVAPLALRAAQGPVEVALLAPGFAGTSAVVLVEPARTATLAYALTPTAVGPAPARVSPTPRAGRGGAPRTSEGLYAEAEGLMKQGAVTAAAARLTRLLDEFPDDALADSARYELGRLERQRGDLDAAATHLTHVVELGRDVSLREPASYLLCHLRLERHDDAGAARCFVAFRAAFPGSPHDAEALAFLAARAALPEGCAQARPLLEAYLARYPRGPFAGDARARLGRCP